MTKTQRISVFLASVTLLFIVFKFTTGQAFPNTDQSLVIFSSLLMLSFITMFMEMFFTVPSDVLASNISILLLIAPLHSQLSKFGKFYWIFFYYNLLLAVISLSALLLLDSNKSGESFHNRTSQKLKKFATSFGNGRFLYCTLFLLMLFFYVDSQSYQFVTLACYATVIILVDPKRLITMSLKTRKFPGNAVGEIIGVHSKNIFLAKLYDQSSISIGSFDVVQFRHKMDATREVCRGMVVSDYILNKERWIRILAAREIQSALYSGYDIEVGEKNVVYKLVQTGRPEVLNRFVGVVIDKSSILKIRFDFAGCTPVLEGSLIELAEGNSKVLYQVVQGVTEIDALEDKDETGLRVGEAIQLGIWNSRTFSFDKYGWVPEINTPIFLATSIDEITPPTNEVRVGTIPGTNYPVLLNVQDAVTHHTAILGVTGSGKSVFCRDLIRKIISGGTKVICVDFTNEYRGRFPDLIPRDIVSAAIKLEIDRAIDTLSAELEKYANQQNKTLIATQSEILLERFSTCVRRFIDSESSLALFDLPDISNTIGILEYTKWFFRGLFKVAREDANRGRQLCIVLEEAHTVIPEWNFIGVDDKPARSVVNSISQIALQGRKYNIGFLVVAQRTANVSKTVLTQCNSIIAFQQFDKTSSDFLTNYMGVEMALALSTLQFRQAVAVGKAFRARVPMIFEVPEITEPAIVLPTEVQLE